MLKTGEYGEFQEKGIGDAHRIISFYSSIRLHSGTDSNFFEAILKYVCK